MWKKFWDYHLKLLIREYVRGMSKSEELEKKLHDAYNLKLDSTEQS